MLEAATMQLPHGDKLPMPTTEAAIKEEIEAYRVNIEALLQQCGY